MVDEQQFHHPPVLRLVGGLGGDLGAHHHVRGTGDRAGRHRLALSLDLDQALTARADRVQQRVIAEAGGDLHAHQFGGADHQRALGNADLGAVDGQRHHLDRWRVVAVLSECHAPTLSGAASIDA